MKFDKKLSADDIKNQVKKEVSSRLNEQIKPLKPFVKKFAKKKFDLTSEERGKFVRIITDLILRSKGTLLKETEMAIASIGAFLSTADRKTINNAIDAVLDEEIKEKKRAYNKLVEKYNKIEPIDTPKIRKQIQDLDQSITNTRTEINQVKAAAALVSNWIDSGITIEQQRAHEVFDLFEVQISNEVLNEILAEQSAAARMANIALDKTDKLYKQVERAQKSGYEKTDHIGPKQVGTFEKTSHKKMELDD